jgi:hypothetical protein
MTIVDRSDFGTVYEVEGVDALNRLLRERMPDAETRLREFVRMEQRGWLVHWNEDSQDANVVGRKLPVR